MIILMPSKTFEKRKKKLVVEKDFIIADAMDDPDSEISEYGNRMLCIELQPTTVLSKIALDPTSEQSKIRAKNLSRYLDSWLNDDGFLMRINFFVDLMTRNFDDVGEDMNIFVVMRKEYYENYASAIKTHINELYDEEIAFLLHHKMEKETQMEIVSKPLSDNLARKLAKQVKRYKKNFDQSKVREMYNEV